jgi:hypothetical protein
MRKLTLLIFLMGCCGRLSYAQFQADDWQETDSPAPFEVYGMASGMGTVDVTATLVIRNPQPGQNLGFSPSGLASGARGGFVWRHDNLGLVADLGFHKYSDHTGSTSLAPLMLGLRVYSDEHFRTSFFGEGLAGGYRWTERFSQTNFTTTKGIVAAGGGMDIRLTRRLVWRVFELQLAIAGARNGPLLTGGPSTGIAYRFGSR